MKKLTEAYRGDITCPKSMYVGLVISGLPMSHEMFAPDLQHWFPGFWILELLCCGENILGQCGENILGQPTLTRMVDPQIIGAPPKWRADHSVAPGQHVYR